MKAIISLCAAIFAASCFSSCTVTSGPPQQGMYGGGQMQYGPQPMPYGQPQMGYMPQRQMPVYGQSGPQFYGNQNLPPDQVIPAGNQVGGVQWYKIESAQDYLTSYTSKVGVQVEAFAPPEVRNRVAKAAFEWCKSEHHNNRKWPTLDQLTVKVQALFRENGFNLRPVNAPTPGGFKIARYDISEDVKGVRQKNGPVRTQPRVNINESEVPQNIMNQQGQQVIEPFSQGDHTIRFIPSQR